jgi:hypothetical protein
MSMSPDVIMSQSEAGGGGGRDGIGSGASATATRFDGSGGSGGSCGDGEYGLRSVDVAVAFDCSAPITYALTTAQMEVRRHCKRSMISYSALTALLIFSWSTYKYMYVARV